MRPVLRYVGAISGLLLSAAAARADWDDRPGFDFHPQTSAAAPCGVGTPPRGHFAHEVAPASLLNGLVLTVKQDGARLCYVSGNIAEPPVIRVRQGEDLVITLRNEINDPAAIDQFVAVANLDTPNPAIPQAVGFFPVAPGARHIATGATNLHVHGFAVPPVAPEDDVLNICVDPAAGSAGCGRREFQYRYHVPADMPAGLYWYHPHVHGEVHAQMLMGLSGAIVVEGPDDDQRRAAGIQDRIFVVRQTRDNDTKAPAATAANPPAGLVKTASKNWDVTSVQPGPFKSGSETVQTKSELACTDNAGVDQISLNGSKVLDGRVADANLAAISIAQGTTQLWRLLNAANDAFLDLALVDESGKPMPITVVARDGARLSDDSGHALPPVATRESQFVSPAGRIEFLIDAPPVGKKLYLVTHAVDTGCTGDVVPERTLALITAGATSGSPAPQHLPEASAAPSEFSGLLAQKTDRERTIMFAEYPRPGTQDLTDFYIAERRPGMTLKPYEMGDAPAITVKSGTAEEWTVENWTNELHAFHFHQLHFRVLAIDGKKLADPPLLDTINIPYAKPSSTGAGGVEPGRVRIKLSFPERLAGDIPFHCHLVDHEDAGMMAVLRILPKDGTPLQQKASLEGVGLLAHPPICRTAATGNEQSSISRDP